MLKRSTFSGEPPYSPFAGFNGQSYRARVVLDLADRLPFDAFVERGTYHGYTSAMVTAQTGLPVYSVESRRRYWAVAQRWKLRFPNRLHLKNGDSRAFLTSSTLDGVRFPLIYLDAHWTDDLPLREEIRIIGSRFEKAVVLIDDFYVPGDDGYGFDQYGDARLDLDLIAEGLPPGARAFFPSVSAEQETGGRRGWPVLAWPDDVAVVVGTERWLRPSELSVPGD